MTTPSRTRLAIMLAVTIALGLGSRARGLPAAVHLYVGDVLWGVMWVLLLALARPQTPRRWLLLGGLAIGWGIELSQLIDHPTLHAIRQTRPGALLLGRGFLWSDMVCVGLGVVLGVGLSSPPAPRGPRRCSL